MASVFDKISSQLRANLMRAVLTICVFVIEFLWVMACFWSVNLKQSAFTYKVFVFGRMLVFMALFEALRWADVVYYTYFQSKETQALDTPGKGASPVDNKYIEKNRGYKS